MHPVSVPRYTAVIVLLVVKGALKKSFVESPVGSHSGERDAFLILQLISRYCDYME